MTTATTLNVKNAIKSNQSKAMTKENSFQGIITKQLSNKFKTIESLVPKHITPERLCKIGLNAVSRNLKLMECTPETVVGAIVNCATLGLEPNLLGHAYIVPFFNGKTGNMEAQFQIGYKGALDLIRRTGQVASISAHEVYEGDNFQYAYGLEEKLIHIPFGEDSEDKITHFYACYKLKNGGTGFIVMTRTQMDKHRDKFTRSKDKQGILFGPWTEHYVSMGLKTAILKLIKYMPISIEQQQNQNIMEGLNRDNTTLKVSDPQENVGFGEVFLESEYATQCKDIGESCEANSKEEGNNQ